MKKFLLIFALVLFSFSLSACDSEDEPNGRPSDAKITLLQFPHLDGYGNEVMRDMPVLFEYEMRDYVKYQVAFVSCTCRAPRVNYWSVAYFDISTNTGEILKISFDEDGTGGYLAGVWGDSDPIPDRDGNPLLTYQDFVDDFLPWIVGKTLQDLDGINIFYNDTPSQYSEHANTKTIDREDLIDAFAGASVSTHSIIRVAKSLLEYHQEKYMD